MEWFRIYRDCLTNLFLFFNLNLFLNSFATCRKKKFQLPIKILFLFIWLVMSLIPQIPYFSSIALLLNLLYTLLLVKGKIMLRFITFIKYEIYYNASLFIITFIHTLLTMDMAIYTTNTIYADYTNIICSFLIYVILSMYIILRKLSDFPSGKIYKRYFLAITGLVISLLVVCSMLLGSTIIKQENIIPVMFSLLLMITLLCMSIYRKVLTVLEENTLSKIEAQKNALQQDYYDHLEDNLNTLSHLRHDFKNYLFTIHDYAHNNQTDKLLNFIESITGTLDTTALIDTPSNLVSSILNAKNEDCKRKHVTFNLEHHFQAIKIDDFHMVTILSNLLDNAITAAAKCENGYIDLQILETNSYLEIDCTNNHQEQIKKKNDTFQTTKTIQTENHGLGIKSMHKAVDKLHGRISIDYTNDIFHVNILLPNY